MYKHPCCYQKLLRHLRNRLEGFVHISITLQADKPSVRTNIGKQSISFMATNIWKYLPTYLKNLSVYTFPKKIKHFLLSEQQTK